MRRNNLSVSLAVALSLVLLTTKSAFALLGGCVDSPEDPTAVLALLGCGAIALPIIRNKIKSSRRQK